MDQPQACRTPRFANVIWIFGDQHRAQATGYAGDPNVVTPHLDRFARESLWVTQAVGGCPLCCPFRGSLLTSRYPHLAVPGHEEPLDPKWPTVAHPFRAQGYRTSYFGKWHVDGHQESRGRAAFHTVTRERRGGFEDWLGYDNNNAQYDCWVHGHSGGEEVAHYRLPGYETDALTDLFLKYLRDRAGEQKEAKGRPFFSVLSVQPPHDPCIAPAAYMGRHTPGQIQFRRNVPDLAWVRGRAAGELSGYYAMIENLDWNFGRIMEVLHQTGLIENTHIIFFSDHGDMHGSHGQFRKTTYFEESIRVPCLIGGAARGIYEMRTGIGDFPLNHVDYGPTSLGLCDLPVPDWMQGYDWSHRRRRGRNVPSKAEPDSAYLQLVRATGHGDSMDRPWRGVATSDGWKYVVLEGQPLALHNLTDDPYEQVNLAYNTKFRKERQRMQDRLGQWISETGDSFQLPQIAI